MWIFANKNTGEVVGSSGLVIRGESLVLVDEADARRNCAADAGLDSADLAGIQISDLAEAKRKEPLVRAGHVEATLDAQGEIISLAELPDSALYLLVEISGAPRQVMGRDGALLPALSPGESFSVSVGLHVADDPGSDLAPTGPDPITWPIVIRTESGAEFDAVPVGVVAGAAAFTYTAPAGERAGRVSLYEADLGPIELEGTSYRIRLMQPVVFYVLRAAGVSAGS